MCEMVNTSTSSSTGVACAADIITKNEREDFKRVYEGQVEGTNQVEKLQRERGYIQSNDQINS